MVESYAHHHGWFCQREDDSALVLQCQKEHGIYGLYLLWRAECHTLQFSCVPDIKVPMRAQDAIERLICLLNNHLWMGHMGIDRDSGVISYRHTALFSLQDMDGSHHHAEKMIESALAHCERFYPSLQMVIWGGLDPRKALESALLDVQGQA
ncbi:MAG: YbjN domain-containing protein [Alphaproteobacteria bacterium GM7ARS4]|nr:YbjN domain-containing protein [Alphaproteobacteria bacterium GM7ARS4]